MFPDIVGFTCYKEDIGALTLRLFRRLGDILDLSASGPHCACPSIISREPLRKHNLFLPSLFYIHTSTAPDSQLQRLIIIRGLFEN